MARRKKSTRKRRRVRRKKPTGKPTADLPATVPPFGRNTNPQSGWNTNDQTANQIVRQYAERQRQQTVAVTAGPQTNFVADSLYRRAPENIHAEILKQIDEIGKIIPQLPGIGHNKPPEPIEPPPPLTSDEIADIKIYIAVVNSLPAVPEELPTALGRASEGLKILGDKIVRYAAITGGLTTLWEKFGGHLTAAGNLIEEWIKVLMNILF
jgi:hypothetical protein